MTLNQPIWNGSIKNIVKMIAGVSHSFSSPPPHSCTLLTTVFACPFTFQTISRKSNPVERSFENSSNHLLTRLLVTESSCDSLRVVRLHLTIAESLKRNVRGTVTVSKHIMGHSGL